MGRHKDRTGQSRLSKILKSKALTKIASFTMDALPIPNIINYLPDRNKDGKRNLKDFKWYEMLGSVAVLAALIKFGIIDLGQVLELIKAIVGVSTMP